MSSSAASPPTTPPSDATRRSAGVTLALIVTCQLMILLDATVVTIALPHIQDELGFTTTTLPWVQNAYLLPFGGLLLLGGRFGDILGRRRIFTAGVAIFTLASLLGGFAQSAAWLLTARAAQGVGAALAAPGTLALIATNFPEGPRRNRALGVFSAVAGSGMVIGLILGGILTSASWRWGLFINVPIGAAVAALTPRYVGEPPRDSGRFDLAGALSSCLGTSALVFGFLRATDHGWTDPLSLGAFAAGAVLLAAFVLIESRARQPILPLRLLAHRDRAGAYLDMLIIPALMFNVFFFLTEFLQKVLGYGPFQAGLAFLPLAVMQLVSARTAPRLIARIGARPLIVTGILLITAGVVWLTRLSADTGYATGVLGPFLLFGTGVGLGFMPLNMTILGGVPPQDSGAASGLLQALQQLGGSLGPAVLIPVFGAASRDAARHPPSGLTHAALEHHVFAHGTAAAYTAGIGFALLALLVTLVGVKPLPRPPRPAG